MRKVFVAGNPLVKGDSLALKIAMELEKKLKGVRFEELDSLASLKKIPDELWLIDVAKGIKKVEKIDGIEKLQELKVVSLHDFDLATELLLYKKIGKLGKVRLIAIPSNYPLKKGIEEIKSILLSESV